MGFKNSLSSVLLITFLIETDSVIWSCFHDGIAVPLKPNLVAGVWYEIARFPSSNVPACVEVVAPESQVNGNYTLELDFINNVNKGWQPTKESLEFPWSEAKNGNFNLHYSSEEARVTIKFKYLGSTSDYAIVCGYSDFATSLSIIRILSRHKLVNSTFKAEIGVLANYFNINKNYMTWVQQDGRCNGSNDLSMFNVAILMLIIIIVYIY